jgi:ADP-heptose:LPS heptosyltransferase
LVCNAQEDTAMTRTLVIQLARLGDVIQTTPLLAELNTAGDEVDVLVLRSAHEPLLGFSAVANIITIPGSLKPLDDAIACGFPDGEIPAEAHDLIADLQLPHYDRIINASHAPLGCWLAAAIPCANPNARYGGIIRDRECLYLGPANSYRVALLQFREQNLFNVADLLRAAHGAALPNLRPCLYANRCADLPLALPVGRKVALNPGASEVARCWPAGNFVRLAEALSAAGFAPLLVGAPSDRELCERIRCAAGVAISNFAGRTTIPEMATLLAGCELLISADTGAVHLAAAVGTTVLGLYGATAWFTETAPYGDYHLILQTPLNAPMSTISVDSVLAASLNRLGRIPADELSRELRRQNQSAWETLIQSPSNGTDGDSLGGLMYRPLHRDALTSDEFFAQALRDAFASEFVAPNVRLDSCATTSLTQIFEHMQTLAISCVELTRTGSASNEISSAAQALIATMEKLRGLAAEPAWRPFSPIIHKLDWQLRILPQQQAEQTFHAHANAYASAARILRRALRIAENMREKNGIANRSEREEKASAHNVRNESLVCRLD